MIEPVDRSPALDSPALDEVPGAAPGPVTSDPAASGPTAPGPAAPVPDRPGAGPPGRPSLGWTEFLVGAVAYVLAFLVLSVIVFLIFGFPAPDRPLPTIPVLAASGLAALIAAVVALSVRVRWRPALGLRATSVRWLLIGLGAGLVAKVLGTAVSFGYVALTGDASNPQDFIANSAAGSAPELIGVLVCGAVLVPIGEELLFRGVAFGSLRRYDMWVAVIASAIVFGLAHGINLVLPAALFLGLVNALLYERSRSIWPAMVSHGVFNASAFVFAAVALG